MKKGLAESLAKMKPDVIGFQETKANDQQVAEALKDISGYHLYSSSAVRPGYSGTAILTKKKPLNVTFGLGKEIHDQEGRTITAEYDDFYLINSYIPNSGSELARLPYRVQWDADMLEHLLALEKKKPIVFMGDLNVAHQAIDLANPKSNYNKSAGYMQQEIDGINNYKSYFVDTFREMYPDTIKYSWWSARFNSRAKNVGWRIDYVLTSKELYPRVKEAFILNEIEGSDHCPVGIDLK